MRGGGGGWDYCSTKHRRYLHFDNPVEVKRRGSGWVRWTGRGERLRVSHGVVSPVVGCARVSHSHTAATTGECTLALRATWSIGQGHHAAGGQRRQHGSFTHHAHPSHTSLCGARRGDQATCLHVRLLVMRATCCMLRAGGGQAGCKWHVRCLVPLAHPQRRLNPHGGTLLRYLGAGGRCNSVAGKWGALVYGGGRGATTHASHSAPRFHVHVVRLAALVHCAVLCCPRSAYMYIPPRPGW